MRQEAVRVTVTAAILTKIRETTTRPIRIPNANAVSAFSASFSCMPCAMKCLASHVEKPTSHATYRKRSSASRYSTGLSSSSPISDALNPRSPLGGGMGVLMFNSSVPAVRIATR